MKRYIIVVLLIFSFGSTFALDNKHLAKVTGILEKVQRFQKNNKTLKGYFSFTVNKGKKTGFFLYKAPHQLKMFFGPEYTKEPQHFRYLISNGKTLWVYLPQYQALVEQEIPEYFKQVSRLGMGLSRFLASYKSLTINEETKKGVKNYILVLKDPIRNVAYQELKFVITDEGFIQSMTGKTVWNNKPYFVAFSRYNIKKNVKIDEKQFKPRLSGDIQIIRNVLLKNK